MTRKIEIPNGNYWIKRYQSGISCNQIAEELDISRSAFMTFLRDSGIQTRTRSEAERIKWAKIKQIRTAVVRQCGGAWSAVCGRTRPHSEQVKRSQTVYANQTMIRKRERIVASRLRKAGFNIEHQFPVNGHNIDLVVTEFRVAMEIQRGDLNRSVSVSQKQVVNILNNDWSLIIAYCPSCHIWGTSTMVEFDFAAVCNKLIAFIEFCSSNPSASGRYGMIGRDGKPISLLRLNLKSWPRILGF